jgi:hypothetical protein
MKFVHFVLGLLCLLLKFAVYTYILFAVNIVFALLNIFVGYKLLIGSNRSKTLAQSKILIVLTITYLVLLLGINFVFCEFFNTFVGGMLDVVIPDRPLFSMWKCVLQY